jgi:N-acetylated-alpha-linked acidic dipeptidase
MRFPGRGHRRVGRRAGLLRHAADWIKSLFGVPPPTDEEIQLLSLRSADSWEEYLEYVARFGDEKSDIFQGEDVGLDGMGLPDFPIHRFIKAAKRVARANQKLIRFERGFISKDGIKDRKWYKHLGVAPGKWLGKQEIIPSSFQAEYVHSLGYGATTFPALTEAVIYEKNVTLIKHEANRLESLLVQLAANIEP